MVSGDDDDMEIGTKNVLDPTLSSLLLFYIKRVGLEYQMRSTRATTERRDYNSQSIGRSSAHDSTIK